MAALRRSRRYGTLHEPLLRRLCLEALDIERGNVRQATKRTKRRLHQIFGAYLQQRPRYARLLAELETAVAGGDEESIRSALRHALSQHASTRERLPILDGFYSEIFARLGTLSCLLDVACGLNPLAVPWMGLPAGSRYIAVDIDTELVTFVAACLRLLEVDCDPLVRDVLAETLPVEADAVLLLKSVPCLDQQQQEGSRGVIERLLTRRVVVSFPTRSIGGRTKGMRETYSTRFERMADAAGWHHERLEFPGELVYIVTKQP